MKLKILLGLIVVFLGIGVIFLSSFSPIASELRTCYEWADQEEKKDKIDADAYGWSKKKVCVESAETLKSLDFCVIKVGVNRNKTPQEIEKAFEISTIMRPDLKSLNERKESHNRSCIEYSDTLLKIRRL